jgi:RNA polymerase sigma-70 factor, ECF subfamily
MDGGHPVHEIERSDVVLTPADEDRVAVAGFLRNRTERSFRVLYARHTAAMLGLATRLLQHDAEDAVQDAWVRAIAALPRFAWRSTLRTWLCGFVVNCCRERSRMRTLDPEIDDIVDPRNDTIDVERALASLPAAAREVFVLHEIYGYTHEEIGEIAGIDAGTSKSQLHNARRTFRAYFEARDGKRTERT